LKFDGNKSLEIDNDVDLEVFKILCTELTANCDYRDTMYKMFDYSMENNGWTCFMRWQRPGNVPLDCLQLLLLLEGLQLFAMMLSQR
jgi:hypothetical protein